MLARHKRACPPKKNQPLGFLLPFPSLILRDLSGRSPNSAANPFSPLRLLFTLRARNKEGGTSVIVSVGGAQRCLTLLVCSAKKQKAIESGYCHARGKQTLGFASCP